MSKKSKINTSYNFSVVEEGYETKIGQEIHDLKANIKEYKSESEKTKMSDLKKLIIILIWIYFYKLFIEWEFGIIYFLCTIIVLIFTNLGKRKPGELSAYSVFNPNFEQLPGTLTSDMIQNGMGFGRNQSQNNIDNETQHLNNNNENNEENTLLESKHEKMKKQIKESFQESLIEIRCKRREGRSTIPASEVYKKYGLE